MEAFDNKRKVVLLKGGQDKWYEQAIFILKDSVRGDEVSIDFVKEAEKIINGQNLQNKVANKYNEMAAAPAVPKPAKSKQPPKKSKFDSFLNATIVITAIVLLTLFAYHFI